MADGHTLAHSRVSSLVGRRRRWWFKGACSCGWTVHVPQGGGGRRVVERQHALHLRQTAAERVTA